MKATLGSRIVPFRAPQDPNRIAARRARPRPAGYLVIPEDRRTSGGPPMPPLPPRVGFARESHPTLGYKIESLQDSKAVDSRQAHLATTRRVIPAIRLHLILSILNIHVQSLTMIGRMNRMGE